MEDFLNKIGPDFFIKEIAERLDSERLRQIADLLIQSEKTKRQLKKLAWNKDILYYVVRLNDDLEIVENFMPFSSKDKAIDNLFSYWRKMDFDFFTSSYMDDSFERLNAEYEAMEDLAKNCLNNDCIFIYPGYEICDEKCFLYGGKKFAILSKMRRDIYPFKIQMGKSELIFKSGDKIFICQHMINDNEFYI